MSSTSTGARTTTFATGPHVCLGIYLAKRELQIAIEVLVSRFRDIRIPEAKRANTIRAARSESIGYRSRGSG